MNLLENEKLNYYWNYGVNAQSLLFALKWPFLKEHANNID
jgi:hypothetical protein